eukprot:455156-Rhodomonas_salina.2
MKADTSRAMQRAYSHREKAVFSSLAGPWQPQQCHHDSRCASHSSGVDSKRISNTIGLGR